MRLLEEQATGEKIVREKMVTYICPMHPAVQREKEGICPQCGMNLIPQKEHKQTTKATAVHDQHKRHSPEIFLRRFVVVFLLTIPILLYSELADIVLKWTPPQFEGVEYVLFILGSIIFFYGGNVFILGAYRELRAKLPGMMTLIALAITAAYIFSVYAVIAQVAGLFWELATLIAVMLFGHWLEMKAVGGAHGALQELAKLLPDTAEVIRGKTTTIIPLEELREGDSVLVKPGAKIPADGIIIEGSSEVNESIVTGESKLVAKKTRSNVIAGTINGDGSLIVKVTKIGEETFLAGVMRLVAEAQASKSRLQILSDKAAFLLTVVAVIAGVLTFLTWLLAGKGSGFAFTRLVAVLVVACPHALGLAVPLVASISTRMAARNGFLVKQRLALEAARTIDTVLFDKTGTLTKGEFGVDAIIPVVAKDERTVLQLAASINARSEHPIAKAIVAAAVRQKMSLKNVTKFARLPGKGVEGMIAGKRVAVGSESLAKTLRGKQSQTFLEKTRVLSAQGKTLIYVISSTRLVGAIALVDVIREESREAVEKLQEQGIEVMLMTGDSEDVASWVAQELKIREFFARVLPGEKSEKVKLLQERGKRVAMVGDGVNDAPALMQANVGIAIGAGTNVAIESAGIILVRNDPRDIPRIIHLSNLTYAKMMQNLFWATGYNVVALPLAAGVLAFKGIILSPALAAVFMSASTVIVALNAVILRRKRL